MMAVTQWQLVKRQIYPTNLSHFTFCINKSHKKKFALSSKLELIMVFTHQGKDGRNINVEMWLCALYFPKALSCLFTKKIKVVGIAGILMLKCDFVLCIFQKLSVIFLYQKFVLLMEYTFRLWLEIWSIKCSYRW